MQEMKALHPIPPAVQRWGYDHIPDVYRKQDPQWEEITNSGSFEAGLCRLVSGWNGEVFSRGPDSWISLDTYSIGIAHWWADTAPNIFDEICAQHPELAVYAWGKEAASEMMNPQFLKVFAPPKRGKMRHDPHLDGLLAGWHAIARHPDVIRTCVEEWFDNYVPAGIELMKKHSWKKGTSLAGMVRITNSRGNSGMKNIIRKAIKRVGSNANEDKIIRTAFVDKNLYNKPERLELIQSWPEFSGIAPSSVSTDSIDFDAAPRRVDGTTPQFTKVFV
ncbi:MAG: hypothetical protein ABJQ71_05940 [Roseibium sp.]